jgi:hypothetical protein
MNKEKLYTYFAKFHGPITPSTHGWHQGTCPFCGKEKLAISFDLGIAKCWRGCFKGFSIDLIRKYHDITYFEAGELIESQEESLIHVPSSIVRVQRKGDLILPKGTIPILYGDGILGDRARKYLVERGFDLNYMDRIGISYCNEEGKYFGRIIIPFKRRGVLAYFIARDYIGDYRRYQNPEKDEYGIGKAELLFNEEALFLKDEVYLVEGWADACTMGEAGVSMQGSTISTIQRNSILKSPVKEVILVPDKGYYLNGLKMAMDFIKFKSVKVLDLAQIHILDNPEAKDANEYGKSSILTLEEHTPWFTDVILCKELYARS